MLRTVHKLAALLLGALPALAPSLVVLLGIAHPAEALVSAGPAPSAAKQMYWYNPMDYGAVCNGVATGSGTVDDTAMTAMTTAIAAANTSFQINFPGSLRCVIQHGINLTGYRGFPHGVAFTGRINDMHLDCSTGGSACVDAMDSRWFDFHNPDILGIGNATTSSTTLTLGTGSMSLTVPTGQTFLSVLASNGAPAAIVSQYNPQDYMLGTVTSYNSGTGALVFNATSFLNAGVVVSTAAGASISGTSLSLTAINTGGPLEPGTYAVTGTGVSANTTATVAGTDVWYGTYTVNNSQTVSGNALTLTPTQISSWTITAAPNVGIQIGRCSVAASDDNIYFEHPLIYGNFTMAPHYNYASEAATMTWPFFSNTMPQGKNYGMVNDGLNHFNIQSAYKTCSQTVDAPASSNNYLYTNGWFSTFAGSTGAPIWMAQVHGHNYVTTYSAAGNGTACIILYQEANAAMEMLSMKHHCEVATGEEVLLTGPGNTGGVFPLQYAKFEDYNVQAVASNGAFFKEDTPLTLIQAQDIDVRIGSFGTGGSASQLWANPAIWEVSGHLALPNIGNWSPPMGFYAPNGAYGCYCTLDLGGFTYNGITPSTALNRNPDWAIDQVFQRSSNSISPTHRIPEPFFFNSVAGGFNAQTFQVVTTNLANQNVSGALLITAGTTATPSATQRVDLKGVIEGPDVAVLQWGKATAQPAILEVALRANNTGLYDFSIEDPSHAHTYIVEANVTATATTQYFAWVIPGPTSTQWSPVTTYSQVGLEYHVSLGCGSNFQASALSWQSGDFNCTGNQFNFTNASGASLQIEYIRLRPGPVNGPYQPRPLASELQLAQRYITGTFPNTVAFGQNKGTSGALEMSAPYASATKNTLSFPWKFPTKMFENNNNNSNTPALTAYNPSGTNANCRDITSSTDLGAATFSDTSDGGTIVTCPVGAGSWALGDIIGVHVGADTGF